MFQRTFLTGLAITLLVVQACGSDDGKKRSRSAADGGAGGEAAGGDAGGPDTGGSSAGQPAAGQPPMVTGGAGGDAPVPSTAGAGGEPPAPYVPEPELLFSVKPGAVGLDETGIRGAEFAQNLIYTTNTGSQAQVDGTNAVKITGESLGLAAEDTIVAFALPQAEPQDPLYLFTLTDGSEGAYTARTYKAYNDGTAESELFYSDGVQSYRDQGDGDGDEIGYNALFASESSLGLALGFESPDDDLTGMAVHDAKQPITELYFAVNSLAVGANGSAVAITPAEERGCTLFKGELDGANSVAFSCAELGLLAGDQLDALAVYAAADSVDVVFSLANGSLGAVGSGVEAARFSSSWIGATLFTSPGDATNAVLKAAEDFGLGDHTDDDIDGLAIIDQPKASVSHGSSCEFTYDPKDAANGGGLTNVTGTSNLGNNVLVVWGKTDTQARLIAYNANTCAFLQQRDLPTPDFDYPGPVAIVPLTDWSAAKPLDNVEYWIAAYEAGNGKELRNYDVAGTYVGTHSIANSDSSNAIERLLYAPTTDQFYLLMSYNYYGPQITFTSLPRPDGIKSIEADFKPLALPCANGASVAGVDTAGNLYLARSQGSADFQYRVCAYAPTGELLPAPYTWNSEIGGNASGFIVPGGSHFLIDTEATPVVVERGVFTAP